MTGTTILLIALIVASILFWVKRRFFGFWAQRPEHYAGQTPEIDIRRHLNGPIECEGVIYGPLGRVTSRFKGDFEATWTGNRGVMTENFTYDDGSTQARQWELWLGNDGRIRAKADDLVGDGSGAQSGPTVQLLYRIRLPESSGGHVLTATDWMYLTPNGTIANRSQFRKFGITVAELVATMRPKEAA